MHPWRLIFGFGLSFCTTLAVGACTPPAATGNCTVDEDCPGRGQFCEEVTNVCMDGEADYTTTLDNTPTSPFPVPFFRGEICTARNLEVNAGSPIPLTYRMCLHECITPGTNHFQHQWSCLSGICSAMTMFWTEGAEGNGCPDEAWGQFNKDNCVWHEATPSTAFGPVELDGTPVEGRLTMEIPFLTNLDMLSIVDYKSKELADQEASASAECADDCSGKTGDQKSTCLENCWIEDKAFQYLQQEDRVLQFDMRSEHPTPPDSCEDNDPGCQCFEIGFG
jgi:hypothetical protein